MKFPLFSHDFTHKSDPVASMYIITNTNNGKKYLGSARNTYNRLATHRSLLKKGKHYSRDMQKDFDTGHVFTVQVYITQDRASAYELEHQWLKAYHKNLSDLYNQALDVKKPKKGFNVTDETRDKLRRANQDYLEKKKSNSYEGPKNPYKDTRVVTINFVEYKTIAEAAEKLNLPSSTILSRVKSSSLAWRLWDYS